MGVPNVTRLYRIDHRDGLWRVSALSAPHRGGETAPLDIGRCGDRNTALRLWLACVGLEGKR